MTLPNMYNALKKWEQQLTLIETTYITLPSGLDGQVRNENPFMAVVQPLKPFQVSLKPAEQRSFEWILIHIGDDAPVTLNVDDVIHWNGKDYKVMTLSNYANTTSRTNQTTYSNLQTYGFMEYHACELSIIN